MPFLDPDDFLPTGLDIRTLLVNRPSATFFMRAKGDALTDTGTVVAFPRGDSG